MRKEVISLRVRIRTRGGNKADSDSKPLEKRTARLVEWTEHGWERQQKQERNDSWLFLPQFSPDDLRSVPALTS